jgi:hypothetical protein
VTPYAKDDDSFKKFKQSFQHRCPFELKDKHFYVRKLNSKGQESFRHLYPLR